MDNITHSLVGVALADALAGGRAARSRRPLVTGAGIIAANLPDIDIAYSVITPAPIGYLLHHRGHTHTIAGLIVLAAALVLAYRSLPPVRAMRRGERLRLWLLIAAGLASHVALDALNSYGVHPFYPVNNRWYYGDAVFIFEPAIWLVLGVAVAMNGRTGLARLSAALPLAVLLLTVALMGVVPLESVAALALVGFSSVWMARRISPRATAGLALTAMVAVVAVQAALAREARAESRRVLHPLVRGPLVDVVLTPNPASPLCWGVIGIESRASSGEYVLWRGTLSLAPAVKAADTCASHRFAQPEAPRSLEAGRLVLRDELHQSIEQLRHRSRHDCWTRAWLRFGRAPVIAGGRIFDLRFAERRTQEFTHMPLAGGAGRQGCPPLVPPWDMPRADLLGD